MRKTIFVSLILLLVATGYAATEKHETHGRERIHIFNLKGEGVRCAMMTGWYKGGLSCGEVEGN